MVFEFHAFELYGFGRSPAEPGTLYGLDPHVACDLAVFCRNPLHPGPCKGWKHTLKAVAPGIHDQVEQKRLERVHARREEKRRAALDAGKPEPKFRKLKHERSAGDSPGPGPAPDPVTPDPVDRKGQGTGRDGDGDGLKGEGEYKKKGRKKAASVEPAPEPAEKRLVTLSPATFKAVDDAVKILPKDDEGWRAVVQKKVVRDDFAELVQLNRRQLDERISAEIGGRDNWRNLVNIGRVRRGEDEYMTWEDLRKAEPDLAADYMRGEGRMRLQSVDEARARFDATAGALKEANEQIARLGGRKPDGTVPDGFVAPDNFRARNFETRIEHEPLDYQTDASGRALPPPELVAMHEAVDRAGAAIRADIRTAIDARKAEFDAEMDRSMKMSDSAYHVTGDERERRFKEATSIRAGVLHKEREIVTDALSQLRPMGGKQFGNSRGLETVADIAGAVPGDISRYDVAPASWRQQLDEAAAHFPDDWVERADRQELMVVSTDRAHMRSDGGDWRKPAGPGRVGIMSMHRDVDPGTGNTAFTNHASEVTYHESGHWMETNIPGLTALEFAYVRSRTTHNGQVEPAVKLEGLIGSGYDDHEITFRDKFADPYTGKTYEEFSGDPVNSHWEAFQVGLQQVFGRARFTDYGGESLDNFVLGVMATLGRS